MNGKRRPTLNQTARGRILAKTTGRCHVCGKVLLGNNWCADHVAVRARGGVDGSDNLLPACWTCNHARWHREPKMIRRVLRLGVFLLREIEKESKLGTEVRTYYVNRLKRSRERRARAHHNKAT